MKSFTQIMKNTAVNEAVSDRIDTQTVLVVLYKRYAEEVLQWYTYHIVSNFMVGKERPNIEKTFAEMADDELNDHAEKILKRIAELGGDVEYLKDISTLKNLSDCDYSLPSKPYDTLQLVVKNIEHEKCAINGYQELCDLTRDKDMTTYDMAVEILKDEEEHLQTLNDFLADIQFQK